MKKKSRVNFFSRALDVCFQRNNQTFPDTLQITFSFGLVWNLDGKKSNFQSWFSEPEKEGKIDMFSDRNLIISMPSASSSSCQTKSILWQNGSEFYLFIISEQNNQFAFYEPIIAKTLRDWKIKLQNFEGTFIKFNHFL